MKHVAQFPAKVLTGSPACTLFQCCCSDPHTSVPWKRPSSPADAFVSFNMQGEISVHKTTVPAALLAEALCYHRLYLPMGSRSCLWRQNLQAYDEGGDEVSHIAIPGYCWESLVCTLAKECCALESAVSASRCISMHTLMHFTSKLPLPSWSPPALIARRHINITEPP